MEIFVQCCILLYFVLFLYLPQKHSTVFLNVIQYECMAGGEKVLRLTSVPTEFYILQI